MDAPGLIGHWRTSVAREDVRSDLRRVYAMVAGEVHIRSPRCDQSGRCCNFEKWDHRLYVTGLETAYALSHLPPPLPAGEGLGGDLPPSLASAGEGLGGGEMPEPRPLTTTSLTNARARGGCPFQIDNLCTIHAIRPLGCRLYYCDPTWRPWQEALAERTHAAIRDLHRAHHIEYRYGEWRDMLELFLTSRPG